MRLFICGPAEGLPEFNRPAFMAAEAQLRALGYDTGNPARLRDGDGWEYGAPQEDLHLLADCDGVAVLEGWQADRRARTQKEVAERVGMTVQHLDTWPAHGPALPPVEDKPIAKQMTGMANAGRGLHQVMPEVEAPRL